MSSSRKDLVKKRVAEAVYYLDECFEIPYVKIKYGWDFLIGLLPLAGDIVAAVLSFYVILEALLLKIPYIVLIRMLTNLSLSLCIGVIPIAGDLFVLIFQANRRNAKLLQRYIDEPEKTEKWSKRWLLFVGFSLICLLITVMALVVILSIYLFKWLLSLL